IVADLSEWRKSGKHFSGELIEHDGISNYPIAYIRCNCWANNADYIHNKFSLVTGEKRRSDMNGLRKVTVSYHIRLGL
ncbi:exodeoxyribonuclease VII large subunit, partial [Francisella tularensis subsp. holarctica]|nr:exodeoxyribonuclease VII large subunit [Francisella tularensis subsp. holarctica]